MITSVAIAAYNGEKYIAEQLSSIFNQTRHVDEVIITDDGSTDKTALVVRSFIEEHKLQDKWKYIINSENLGYAENFRHAMDLCSGDLIFLCDQDDIWINDRVEVMTDMMERQEKIGLLVTEYKTFHDGEVPNVPPCGDKTADPITLDKYNRFLRSLGCAMCVRASFYGIVKELWYNGWAHDEFLWSLSLLYECGYRTSYCSVLHRIHQKQVSGHLGHSWKKRAVYLEDVINSSQFLLEMCQNKEMPKKFERLFKKNVTAHRYRLELVRDRRLTRAVLLLPYLGYYYSKKSYFVELSMALSRREGGNTV